MLDDVINNKTNNIFVSSSHLHVCPSSIGKFEKQRFPKVVLKNLL